MRTLASASRFCAFAYAASARFCCAAAAAALRCAVASFVLAAASAASAAGSATFAEASASAAFVTAFDAAARSSDASAILCVMSERAEAGAMPVRLSAAVASATTHTTARTRTDEVVDRTGNLPCRPADRTGWAGTDPGWLLARV